MSIENVGIRKNYGLPYTKGLINAGTTTEKYIAHVNSLPNDIILYESVLAISLFFDIEELKDKLSIEAVDLEGEAHFYKVSKILSVFERNQLF